VREQRFGSPGRSDGGTELRALIDNGAKGGCSRVGDSWATAQTAAQKQTELRSGALCGPEEMAVLDGAAQSAARSAVARQVKATMQNVSTATRRPGQAGQSPPVTPSLPSLTSTPTRAQPPAEAAPATQQPADVIDAASPRKPVQAQRPIHDAVWAQQWRSPDTPKPPQLFIKTTPTTATEFADRATAAQAISAAAKAIKQYEDVIALLKTDLFGTKGANAKCDRAVSRANQTTAWFQNLAEQAALHSRRAQVRLGLGLTPNP
jgi:hypothetical protein